MDVGFYVEIETILVVNLGACLSESVARSGRSSRHVRTVPGRHFALRSSRRVAMLLRKGSVQL